MKDAELREMVELLEEDEKVLAEVSLSLSDRSSYFESGKTDASTWTFFLSFFLVFKVPPTRRILHGCYR